MIWSWKQTKHWNLQPHFSLHGLHYAGAMEVVDKCKMRQQKEFMLLANISGFWTAITTQGNPHGLFCTAQIKQVLRRQPGDEQSGGSQETRDHRDEIRKHCSYAARVSQRTALDCCTSHPAQSCFLLAPSCPTPTQPSPCPSPPCVTHCFLAASLLMPAPSATDTTSSCASLFCCTFHHTWLHMTFLFHLGTSSIERPRQILTHWFCKQ